MVATRSAARKQAAPEPEPAAPAKKTLKAPPKRATKKAPAKAKAEPPKAETEVPVEPAAPKTTRAKAKPAAASKKAAPAKTESKAAPAPKKAAPAKEKPAPVPKKAAVPKTKPAPAPKKAAPAPKIEPTTTKRTTRATRSTVIEAPPASPLKRPARKPAVHQSPIKRAPRKAAKPAKPATPVQQNPFEDFPNWPSTPAVKPTKAATPVQENPFEQYPNWPSTPAVKPPKETTPIEENPFGEHPNWASTPAHIEALAESQPVAEAQEVSIQDVTMEDVFDVEHAPAVALDLEAKQVVFAPEQLPVLAPPVSGSPIKSAMRSPQKESPQKKSVTFNAHPYSAVDSSLLVTDGPLSGTIFYVDVQSNGKPQNHLFVGLLEDLGAQVIGNWNSDYIGLTHVLFKDGNPATLQKVKATNGAVKCVNIGWAIDCEKNNKRMDEEDYAVNLNQAPAPVSTPAPRRLAWTPARTPSQFFNFLSPITAPATPSTPGSSEWDRSLSCDNLDETDKENKVPTPIAKPVQQTCPAKPQSLVESILKQSPIKFALAPKTVARPMKRKLETFGGISMAPPKKLRFF